MSRRPIEPVTPPALTELTKLLDSKQPLDYGMVIAEVSEIIMARIEQRQHHLQALVILGRALWGRGENDDVNMALQRFQQAHQLALKIAGSQELIFKTGCYLAEAYARVQKHDLADEIMGRMERLVGQEGRGARRRFFDQRCAAIAACSPLAA